MDILTVRLKQFAGAIDARFEALERRVLPAGGSGGQILTKNNSNNYDAAWMTGITVDTSPPSNPIINQLWVDTN